MKSLPDRVKVLMDIDPVEKEITRLEVIELCQIIRSACIDLYNPDRPDIYPAARHVLWQAVVCLEKLEPTLPHDVLFLHWRKALELARRHLVPRRTPAVVPISQPPSCAELAQRASVCLAQWEAWKPDDRGHG